jgi:hypothetical protein
MVIKKCMSAFIMTEKELVTIERVPGYSGWLKVSKPFIGPHNMSIGLLGLCLRACRTTPSIEPDELEEATPDAYYPREETEPPSSSSKANPSSTSYS